MNISVLKRKIKAKLSGKASKPASKGKRKKKNSSFVLVSGAILGVVLVIFCFVQLLVASTLSPRGKELKRLDSEKEILLEENRKLEQEIAEYSSLNLIKNRAETQLDMKRAEEVIYVNDQETTAEAAN
jgi:cell division protein FtsB